MSVDDYVALGPGNRQLLEFGELPDGAKTVLDLAPLSIYVIYPEGFEHDYPRRPRTGPQGARYPSSHKRRCRADPPGSSSMFESEHAPVINTMNSAPTNILDMAEA
jgi:hypothetical protein